MGGWRTSAVAARFCHGRKRSTRRRPLCIACGGQHWAPVAAWGGCGTRLHLGSSVSQPRRHSRQRLQAGRLWIRASRSMSGGRVGEAMAGRVDMSRHAAPAALRTAGGMAAASCGMRRARRLRDGQQIAVWNWCDCDCDWDVRGYLAPALGETATCVRQGCHYSLQTAPPTPKHHPVAIAMPAAPLRPLPAPALLPFHVEPHQGAPPGARLRTLP